MHICTSGTDKAPEETLEGDENDPSRAPSHPSGNPSSWPQQAFHSEEAEAGSDFETAERETSSATQTGAERPVVEARRPRA